MLGLVNRPNNVSLSRANQSQARFKSAVGGNLLQSWVNLTIVIMLALCHINYQHQLYRVPAILSSWQKKEGIRHEKI